MGKIRVLHFIPGFLFGGIESVFLNWYQSLDTSKFDFELLLRTQDDAASALVNYKNLNGIYYRLDKLSATSMMSYAKSVKRFFAEHYDYDILHAHNEDVFVFYYAKKYGIKHIILHSHTTSIGKGVKYIKLKKMLSVLAMIFPTHYLACSEEAAIWKFGLSKLQSSKVLVLENSINSDKFIYNESIRNEYRLDMQLTDKFVVGHVGRMTYPKNHPFLLDVFYEVTKKYDKAVLILIGDGPDKNEIISKALRLGISERVLFLGVRDDVSQLMQAMDVLLLPSFYEGFCITLIEAQTSGLQCVISADTFPNNVLLADSLDCISLEESARTWANTVLKYKSGYKREDLSGKIITAGFDAKNNTRILESHYLNILKR